MPRVNTVAKCRKRTGPDVRTPRRKWCGSHYDYEATLGSRGWYAETLRFKVGPLKTLSECLEELERLETT